ncbi:MAG: hypothetical protein AVDCRST_MAG79-68, partial [uncultured Thermoleophilia bacterium]
TCPARSPRTRPPWHSRGSSRARPT